MIEIQCAAYTSNVLCSTKGQASLVIGKQRQREKLQKRRWAEEEAGSEVARG